MHGTLAAIPEAAAARRLTMVYYPTRETYWKHLDATIIVHFVVARRENATSTNML